MQTEKAKVQLNKIREAYQGISEIAMTFDFPIKDSYYLSRAQSLLESRVKAFEKADKARIETYGEQDSLGQLSITPMIKEKRDGKDVFDEKGNPKIISNPNWKKYLDEVEEALNTEEEIEYLPIALSIFEKASLTTPVRNEAGQVIDKRTVCPAPIKPVIIKAIDWMIIEESSEPEERPEPGKPKRVK